MQDRKVFFVDSLYVAGDGRGFHLSGVAVPDIKDIVGFIVVCANQIADDLVAVEQQPIGYDAYTAAVVFMRIPGFCSPSLNATFLPVNGPIKRFRIK